MASTTSINDLNIDCLREVFLNIDVNERMKLRKVCKQWCKVIDDCWREVRKVFIFDPTDMDEFFDVDFLLDVLSDDDNESVTGTHRTVFIRAMDQKLIENVMKRCGDVIKTLMEARHGKDNSSLPTAIKYSSNLEDFIAAVDTKVDDKNAGQLFALNKKLRHLNLEIRFQNTRICFRKIPTDHLESLCFHVMNCNPSSLILVGQKKVIGRCSSSLKQVFVNYFDDELVKLIGQKITLERLGLSFEYCHGVTRSVLHHILTLKNLKELTLNPADASESEFRCSFLPVTDDFLGALVENLPLLEAIQIVKPANMTNKGFKSLAALKKLQKLKITNCAAITDECVFLFSGLEELDLNNCRIRDAGVIRLLKEAKTLRKLNLENSFITDKTVLAANEAMKKRESGIRLSLNITGTPTTPITSIETSPLLEIINNDNDEEDHYDDDDDTDDDDDEYFY